MMRMGLRLLVFALTGLAAPPALAHPHVWVTVTATLNFDDAGRVATISNHWTFDKAFSAYATQGLDANGDGALSRDELAGLAKENLEGLAEFGWFTNLKADGVRASFRPPQGGAMEWRDGRLDLTFELPLEKPLAAGRALMLEISDPTYFVAFSVAETPNAVSLKNGPAGCVTTITRPAPPAQPSGKLTEDFFNALTAASNYGSQFANKVVVACP